jgi:ubiquinone biosynthesis protein
LIEELRRLQDSVPPVPAGEIRRLMAQELGRPLEAVFRRFDDTPVAAASVAQVHAAELHSGAAVAVKVVRPGIARKIRGDIRLMYALAGRLEKVFESARGIGAVNVVREFERTVFQELDMQLEAASMEKFARRFRATDAIVVPKVHWDFTTRSVLVMDFVAGVKVDQVAQIRALGINPREIAMIGLRCLSRQLMEFGFFHADPHPGNTIVMADGRVALIDFGIMGYLDEELMQQIALLFLGYAERDYDRVLDALTAAGVVDPERVDLSRFRADLKEISEPFYGRSLQTIQVMEVYAQVMDLVLRHGIRLPRNLLLLLKTFIQTESLGKILGSDASILEVIKPYAHQLLQRTADSGRLLRQLGLDAHLGGGLLRSVPRLLGDLLRRAARGQVRIELRHSGLDAIEGQMERGINRLTVGLIIAASTIAGSLVLNSSQAVIEFRPDWLGGQCFSLTALLGVLGYSIATLLGLWLIVAIIRSRRL